MIIIIIKNKSLKNKMKATIFMFTLFLFVEAEDICGVNIVLPANTNTCSQFCTDSNAICSYTMTDYMSTDVGGEMETCVFNKATTVYDGCATSLCTTTG